MSALNIFFFSILSLHLPRGVPDGQPGRFDRDQYTWKSDSSQLLSRAACDGAATCSMSGILFLFFGHFVGLLTPHFVYEHFITAPETSS